jgi:hypothetical protein
LGDVEVEEDPQRDHFTLSTREATQASQQVTVQVVDAIRAGPVVADQRGLPSDTSSP